MKKTLLSIIISLFVLLTNAQILTQSNFTGNIVPQVMGSLTGTRLPLIYRATLTGLAPNTVYRYFTNMALRTDIGTTNSGAGNPLYISTSDIRYTTGASLSSLGNYDSLTTNSSGSYTGWFAAVNTGNTRFTGGNYVFPSIVLDSAGSKRGVVNSRFCFATDSVLVLTYATASGATNGSFIRGSSSGTAKNLVLLFQDTVSTNRPLSIGIIESIGVTIASIVPDYATNVQSVSGAWGTIIPNTLSNGVRRIEQRSLLTGSYINGSKSTNGTWGTTNTVNPLNGTTALVIASTNAPLPVKLNSFNAEIKNKQTVLNWSTASETNNKGFEVQRSYDGIKFETIVFVNGIGNSNKIVNYNFIDNNNLSAFYRLNQIDFDGNSELSKVVSVKNNEILLLQITPNPFANSIEIVTNKNIISAEIIDITGKTKVLEVINGTNASIDTHNLSNGVYFIRVNNGETIITKRIIKN
ncbi:MAG: T9SS type A sorting domain-containing protein [Bacteroidota bacterium]|jgi:hypothetical protein